MMPKWQKLQKGNPCKMRYHNITKDDMLNGDGLRAVLWVAGCTHKCKGCHNPVTWDIEGGIPFDEAAKEELFEALKPDYITGVTFSGGTHCTRQIMQKLRYQQKRSEKHFQRKPSGYIQDFAGMKLRHQML